MFVCAECGASAQMAGRCAIDGTPLHPIGEDLLLGQTIGVYRVARLLGVGGMGRVYKGVHPSIGSRVAIKVLSRECSDRRDLVERFFAEARAVNLIRHESIVNVLDLATLPDGRPFIIMEYLDGASLSTLLEVATARQQRLPLGSLARLAAEVLDALEAAHGKGVVHRDLKPDNVYVMPSGRPKVLDFGIAKLSDVPMSAATRTGSLLGTPHYMAPEQASGKPVDPRTDVYAMGVILFECATGQKPFVAESLFDLLRKHVDEPPPSPRMLRPDMPGELEQVILCALAKDPSQRFGNARAMSMALQHATQHLPPGAWQPLAVGLDLASTLPRAFGPSTPGSWSGSSPSPQATQSAPAATTRKKGRAGLVIGVIALGAAIAGIAFAVGRSGSTPEAPPVVEPPSPEKIVAELPPEIDEVPDISEALAVFDDPMFEQFAQDPERKKIIEELKQIGTLPPAEPPANDATSDLVERHSLVYSRAQRLDADAFIAAGLEEVREIPDARLQRFILEGVAKDGTIDLDAKPPGRMHKYDATLRFVSPARQKAVAGKRPPPGKSFKCGVYVHAAIDDVEIYSPSSFGCRADDAPITTPTCTVKQIWTQALTMEPAIADAVAEIDYRSLGGKVVWHFTTKAPKFEAKLRDSCP